MHYEYERFILATLDNYAIALSSIQILFHIVAEFRRADYNHNTSTLSCINLMIRFCFSKFSDSTKLTENG